MKTTKLYKFQPVTKYTISNLIQRKLYLPTQEMLNDPFEFRVPRIGKDELLAYLDSQNKVLPKNSSDEKLCQELRTQLQNYMKSWGVVCYTKKRDNLLMWAHYADMHRGFCMEFTIETRSSKGSIFPVKYSKQYPAIDFSKGWHIDGFMKIPWTKSIDWKYEKEWRSFNIGGGQFQNYVGKLTGIIFGSKMPQQDRKTIESILKDEVKYYDSKLSETEFKVEIMSHLAEK